MPATYVQSDDDRARSSRVHRESWARDPHARRRAIALGQVKALLRKHPGDLNAVIAAVHEAVAEADSEPGS